MNFFFWDFENEEFFEVGRGEYCFVDLYVGFSLGFFFFDSLFFVVFLDFVDG